MSTNPETTAAVRRGADASWTRSDDMTRDEIAAVVLAAALDVEEMARAGHADSCCTDFDGCDLTFDRNVARAHVAAILGSDS